MLTQINSVLHLAADACNRHNPNVNSADSMSSPLHVWRNLLEPLPPDASEKASRKRAAPEPSTAVRPFRTFALQGELKKPYKFDGPDPLDKPHTKSPDGVADKQQGNAPVQQYAPASSAPLPLVMSTIGTKATPAKAEAETASPPGTPLSPHPTPRALGSPQVPRGRGRANGSARSRQRDRRRERNTAPPHPSRTVAAPPAPSGSGRTLHPLPDMTNAGAVSGATQCQAGGAAVAPPAPAAASTAARPIALVSTDAVTAAAVRVSRPYRRAVRRHQQSTTTTTTNGQSGNAQRSTRLATVDAVTAAALRVRDAVRRGYMAAWSVRRCSLKDGSSNTQRDGSREEKGAGASWGRLLLECVSSVVAVLLCGVVWDGMPWGRLLDRLAGGAA